jgi:hypothetical protein
MQHQRNARASEQPVGAWFMRFRFTLCCCIAFACGAAFSAHSGVAQGSGSPGGALRMGLADLPTPINRPPDAIAQIKAHMRKAGQQNFDAANALRLRQIADEALQLLVLARDLKSQMEKMGDRPLPSKLLREAEVIEILARDVQTKMTLTVGTG